MQDVREQQGELAVAAISFGDKMLSSMQTSQLLCRRSMTTYGSAAMCDKMQLEVVLMLHTAQAHHGQLESEMAIFVRLYTSHQWRSE